MSDQISNTGDLMMRAVDPNKVEHGRFVARDLKSGEYINLAGNYDYLGAGYYLSQDYELANLRIRPTCKEMLDAYVPPLFLEKARLAGIPIPEYYISNGYFEPPVVVDPVNPFTLKGKVVLRSGRAKSIAKSLSRNYTYAVCCQQLPEDGKVVYFQSVLGWSVKPQFREFSRHVWEIFGIPLATVRLIRSANDQFLLSDISPLFLEDLGVLGSRNLEERVSWDS